MTGGNGSIYAVRRSEYVEVDPRFGHDLSLPYLMVQHGRRAVYEPAAVRFEKPTPSNESEYRRKVRMFEHCWLIVLRGQDAAAPRPAATSSHIVSHRICATRSGLLHLVLLATLARARHARLALRRGACRRSSLLLAAAAAGVGIARYYVLVTWATVVSLWNYLRRGVPATWEAAEGTR